MDIVDDFKIENSNDFKIENSNFLRMCFRLLFLQTMMLQNFMNKNPVYQKYQMKNFVSEIEKSNS